MNTKTTLAALATALLLSTSALAQTSAGTGAAYGAAKRIIPGGQDGDYTYYTVSCSNKARVSVIVEQSKSRVCAQPRRGQPRCLTDWPIEQAAAHACANSERG